MDRFARNAKFLRFTKGYSQQKIASLLHVSRSTYLRLECGKTPFSLEQLNILSNFYDVDFDFLVSFDIAQYVLSVISINPSKGTQLSWHIIQKNIKLLRTTHGLSQEYVASSIHLSRSTYSAYETGVKTPDIHTLFLIASLFNVDFETILYYDLSSDSSVDTAT